MKYQPITCVWEITMGCNMRCGHCGSSCAEPLEDELDTQAAFNLCDQIAELGVHWISLTGGEPLTRKDVAQLVQRLSQKGIVVNMVTNGWFLSAKMAKDLKESGISTVAISIDGTEAVHDSIRKKDAFQHARQAYAALKENQIQTGAVTTVTKQNIEILDELKEELIRMGVDSWQLQLGLPMGNLRESPDWLLEPAQMKDIIDFCYDTAVEGRIKIYPADCIGYYTVKEQKTKQISFDSPLVSAWDGCNAGIRGFGILQNGDILGCTSIRDKSYIEGNVTKRPLREIWEDENSFLWRRSMSRDKLTGHCRICTYAGKCLGGCPNTRLTMNGSIQSENQYCAYYSNLEQMEHKFKDFTDPDSLYLVGQKLLECGNYQEASFAFGRVTELAPKHAEACKAKGFCDYMCGNYEICKEENTRALALCGSDPYALQGYAIAQYRLGETQEGLQNMRKAVSLTKNTDQELLRDLQWMEQSLE